MQRHGPRVGQPLLLIRGLGSQLIHWPQQMLKDLVAAGFDVFIYDNRDSGWSQKFDSAGVPSIASLEAELAKGISAEVPYTIGDMAQDAVGVLDAYGVDTAHVLGISMGGMILQKLAGEFPERLRTATIVASSSGSSGLPARSPEVQALLLSEPSEPGREGYIAHTLKCDRVWGSPGYPFDEEERRALIERAYDRCYCPDGITRQYAAIIAGRGGFADLENITVPTLVIHGADDALLPVEHGKEIAARIPDAELVIVPGMGHDLEGGIQDIIVKNVTSMAMRHDAEMS